jgi:hypothetical protein
MECGWRQGEMPSPFPRKGPARPDPAHATVIAIAIILFPQGLDCDQVRLLRTFGPGDPPPLVTYPLFGHRRMVLSPALWRREARTRCSADTTGRQVVITDTRRRYA